MEEGKSQWGACGGCIEHGQGPKTLRLLVRASERLQFGFCLAHPSERASQLKVHAESLTRVRDVLANGLGAVKAAASKGKACGNSAH